MPWPRTARKLRSTLSKRCDAMVRGWRPRRYLRRIQQRVDVSVVHRPGKYQVAGWHGETLVKLALFQAAEFESEGFGCRCLGRGPVDTPRIEVLGDDRVWRHP